jgi:hypothetical protein
MDIKARILSTEQNLVALARVLNEEKAKLEQMKKADAPTPSTRKNLKQQRVQKFALFYTKRKLNKLTKQTN